MFSYLYKKQKKRFFLYTAAVVVATGLEIALAYVMSICVELAINRELSQFARYGVIFLGYVGLVSLSDYLVKYLRARVLENAQIELRNDSTRRLLAMDFASFHQRNTGDWVSLLTNDVELVGQSYDGAIVYIPEQKQRKMGGGKVSRQILECAGERALLWVFAIDLCGAIFPRCDVGRDGSSVCGRADRCRAAQRLYHCAAADL